MKKVFIFIVLSIIINLTIVGALVWFCTENVALTAFIAIIYAGINEVFQWMFLTFIRKKFFGDSWRTNKEMIEYCYSWYI